MALKKLPGGVVVETGGGARLNEEAGINLEAIHRQIVAGGPTSALAKAEADRAEAAAKDAAASLATVTWRDRGTLTAGQDAAALPAETGVWRILSSSVVAAMTGLPAPRAGILVQTMNGPGVGYRTYATYGVTGPASGVWLSMRESTTAWGPWVKLGAPTTVLGVVQVSTFEPAGTAPRTVVGAPSLTHGPHAVVDSRMDSHTPDAGPVTP